MFIRYPPASSNMVILINRQSPIHDGETMEYCGEKIKNYTINIYKCRFIARKIMGKQQFHGNFLGTPWYPYFHKIPILLVVGSSILLLVQLSTSLLPALFLHHLCQKKTPDYSPAIYYIYIYMYIYVYIYIYIYIYICNIVTLHKTRCMSKRRIVCVCIHIYIYTDIDRHIYICTCMCGMQSAKYKLTTQLLICGFIWIYGICPSYVQIIYIYVCVVYIYIYVCMCIYIYIVYIYNYSIHIYIYIHTYIHTLCIHIYIHTHPSNCDAQSLGL